MIRFENVTKVYNNTNVGLYDASFHIEKGDFAFIVGPSGAGKSTLINLILRDLLPDSGSIYVNGKDITRFSNREIPDLRRSIGMVFQDYKLLPNKTVFENVAFAMEVVHTTRRTINRQVPQALSLMGIEDKADRFPQELSQGQCQRVGIARAIINNPDIIIADEPTGSLDPDTAWEIMKLLEQINKRGTTILMVTHAKDIVNQMKKRVISIEKGRIVNDMREGVYNYND